MASWQFDLKQGMTGSL